MKPSRVFLRITKVPQNATLPVNYTPRYSPLRKMNLSSSFDVVTEKNRFLSLEILFSLLSGHAGRKQYPIVPDVSKYVLRLKNIGIDWQQLKSKSSEDLILLFDSLNMSHTERAVCLEALSFKVCGVLCQETTRFSSKICMRPGSASFGWRCGVDGHIQDVYFEGKGQAIAIAESKSSIDPSTGVRTSVHSEPNFSVVGRFSENLHPRVWKAPDQPQFIVDIIGYEFRVHPKDPRAKHQIENAAEEWDLHASVTKQVIWEMLEMYATERSPQPLHLKAGEILSSDTPIAYSNAFNSPQGTDEFPEGAVERKMIMSASATATPWFMPPLKQRFESGIPLVLPYAPTIIVKSMFQTIPRSLSKEDERKYLVQPVMKLSVFVHPRACFFWSKEKEDQCIEQILQYARRLPFPLPFYLYLRVDSSRHLKEEPQFSARKNSLMKNKIQWFDIRRFCEVHLDDEKN